MKRLGDYKPGEDVCLVFKGQHAFVPQANSRQQTMEMVLNVIHGTFIGFDEDTIKIETESSSGVHVVWDIDKSDVLMLGRKIEGANIARVQ